MNRRCNAFQRERHPVARSRQAAANSPLSSSNMWRIPSLIAKKAPRSVSLPRRSEEHTSELQSLMRISYAVFCLKKKKYTKHLEQTQSTTKITIQLLDCIMRNYMT